MKVTPVSTPIVTTDTDLFELLADRLTGLCEQSVVAVTSKIVSICEGRVVPIKDTENTHEKDELIAKESTLYLPRSESSYNVSFAIRDNILAPSAGIDESNGNGYYILWPENLQDSANRIRAFLRETFKLQHVGVIITDSKTSPLRWGVTGIALSHSGFRAINDYIGKKDLFGREFEYEKVNVMDSLAASAAIVMGEGAESTPLAVITDVPFVAFQSQDPTSQELQQLRIPLNEDLYGPFLSHAPWKKGKK